MTKYDVYYKQNINAFSLFDKEDFRLFAVGETDIVVMKNEYKRECSTKPLSYDYGNDESPLRTKLNDNETTLETPECVEKAVKVFLDKTNW